MKKALVTRIVVLSVIVIFLIGALVYGMGNSFGLGSLIRNSANSDKYIDDTKITQEADSVNSFDVDWNSGLVVFSVYNGDTVEISESATKELSEDEKLSVTEDGSTLKIKWDQKSGFNFGFGMYSKKLEIKIPESMEVKSIKVSASSADVSAEGLKTSSLDISGSSGNINFSSCLSTVAKFSSASGDIRLSGVTAKELNCGSVSGDVSGSDCIGYKTSLSSTSGNVDFSGSFESIKSETISGNNSLVTDIAISDAELSSVSGNVDFTLPEDCGFTASHSSVSGDFSSGFGADKSIVNGDGSANVKLSTTSGNIKLKGGSAAKQLTDPFAAD